MFKIPPFSTTMIGSMPQTTGTLALECLHKYPLSIPVWPQLPARSFKEAMTAQYNEGFPGIKVDEAEKRVWVQRDDALLESIGSFYENVMGDDLSSFAITAENASGLIDYINALPHHKERFPFLKGQVTGPFTLGLGVNDQEGRALWFDEQYKDVIIKGLSKKAMWQFKQFKPYGDNIVIFFDEPILSALGTPAYMGISDDDVIAALNEVFAEVQAEGAAVGVHCCGNMDWGLLSRSNVNIISFDAYEFGEKVALYAQDFKNYLARGDYLAWGLVPTDNPELLETETAESLKQRFDQLIKVFTGKRIPLEQLMTQALVTPACGLGNLSEATCERALSLLQEVGVLLRA